MTLGALKIRSAQSVGYNRPMRITGLALQHIRAHSSFFIAFDSQTTVVVGDNATGKTTLMESVYLLATGGSFRAEKIEEMIEFDQELGRVKGAFVHDEGETRSQEKTELEILLTRGEVQGKKAAHRLYTVNGVRRRKVDAVKQLSAVVFRPEDMRLVEGSPARRRAFLDAPLSSSFPEYARDLKTYEQTLRRRNKLLTQVREGEQPRTSLHYWNTTLATAGERIQRQRRDFLQSFVGTVFPLEFSVVYQPSVISDDRIAEYLPREIAAGHTLIGPHKDDFVVQLMMQGDQRNIALFGSRGQQRMAVLWLKFSEFSFLEQQTGQQPLLLLDDILSELDEETRGLALSVVKNCQSIITTTEPAVVALLQTHLPKDTLAVTTLSHL
jgi:DNA replication and repair protein RecF